MILQMILPRPRCVAAAAALLLGLSAAPAVAEVRVEIKGLAGAELDNVKARLSLRTQAETEKDALDEARIRRLHQRSDAEIREALQPFGYYSAQIESRLESRDKDWIAHYRIDAGPPTKIASIDAQFEGAGADFEALTTRLRRLPLRIEERLIHTDYEATKKRMSDAALANGFLDARWIASELIVEPQMQRARVTLRLDTGPRYFFGPVSIEQDELDPEVVERYVVIREGEPFDPAELLALQFRLSDLGYFQAVEIEPQRELSDDQRRIPIKISTTPRARTRYNFGVGYGTDTGARVSVGSQWRRLNRQGHTLESDFRLSEIKNTLGATYRIPVGSDPTESLSFNAITESERLDAGDTLKYLIGASLNQSPGASTRRLYLEYAHEESEFGDARTTSDLFTPGVSLTRSAADDPVFTRRGWYLFGDVHGALNKVLSNSSFLQTRVLARGVYPLLRRVRLLARAEFGYTLIDQFSELPASQRFFAGGDQSVRGYRYESLGPRDDEGNVIGGRYLNVFSVESEVRVTDKWGAAVFLDAGGADDHPGPNLSKGVGAGVRYRAPIGSLQLDLAHPLDDGKSGVRFHIGVRVGV